VGIINKKARNHDTTNYRKEIHLMEEKVSLDTIGQGAAVERFNLALQDVLNNIQDPNTSPKAARIITLKATIKSDEDRAIGDVAVEVTTKLAPIKSFLVRLFMGRDKAGKGVASEYVPGPGLFDQVGAGEAAPENKPDKVYQLNKGVNAQ
jgi:hypothetical protein